MSASSSHRLNRLASFFGLGFVVVAGILVPNATIPPTLAMGDPTIEFHAPKFVLVLIAAALGWSALLLHLRNSSIVRIARTVWFDGPSKWVSLFIVGIVLAGASSPDGGWIAMLGRYARMDGALVMAAAFHVFQLGHALVTHRVVALNTTTMLVAVGGALVSGILLFEASGTHIWSLPFPQITLVGAPVGTVGNTGAITNYLCFVYVLAVMSAVQDQRQGRWYLLLAFVMALGVAVHIGRSGVVAALIVLPMAAVLLLRFRSPRWYVPVLGAALLLGTITLSSFASNRSAIGAERLASLTTAADQDVNLRHRFVTWELGLRSVIDNPLVGTGPGTFADRLWLYASDEQDSFLRGAFIPAHLVTESQRDGITITVYDPDSDVLLIRVANYEKVHNYFLDIGVAYGLIAMVLAIMLWTVILLRGWERFPATPQLLVSAAVFLLAQQFWFFSISVDPALYLAFGALAAQAPRPPPG